MISAPPSQREFQDENRKPTDQWIEFNSDVYRALVALQLSGTTAQRPLKGLYVGRPFFDTTLNRPIWYSVNNNWIRADGVVV